ncbi:carbohydrate ABC transporter permease [Cellulosimicrobium sp. CUA-896]|uniref:carbohydrate ABC transporter permease n=1 Tax=Cellulosimicrobium sp. CUA-896 TaxID=1517881 RepID=UPI00095F5F4B|nr:carbohydrate ABC transporter permease [Cellulosimicrobium sp. CUA-896]OLT54337.1 sugar ABC transporter permease [Cellulosimicrobium sp. CUA-896]
MTTATPTRGPVRQSPGRSAAATPRTGRRRTRPGTVAATVAALVVAAVWVFPVYWMVNTSLLPRTQVQSRTPTFVSLDAGTFNYASVLEGSSFLSALRMSLVVTLSTVVLVLVFAFLAALAISRFRFRGRKSFVVALLFIQMLPAEGLFIAQYRMLSSAELLNTAIGVTVLYTAAVVPFTVWMLRGFVAGVPAELEEAAMVDGLSRTGAFVRITFPLLAPGLVAAGVYAFLQAWNEFTIALVALPSNQAETLPLWLRSFLNSSVSQGVNWGEVMAASTLIAVPVIVFFLVVQGRMTGGLVSGAVKG